MTFTALMDESTRREHPATHYPHAAYPAALGLVTCLEQNLASGRRHYRAKTGVLLTTLDQVIKAIMNHELEEVA